MSPLRGPAVGLLALLLVIGGLLVLRYQSTQAHNSRSGTGLTYDGRFYLASGAEVRVDALGAVLATGVAFQDTTADLRAITGLDPAVTLAAHLPPISTQVTHVAWILVSTDEQLGADPAAYAQTRDVLVVTN